VPPCCRRAAAVLPLCCRRAAIVLPPCCCRAVAVLPPCYRNAAAMLPPCCGRAAAVLPSCRCAAELPLCCRRAAMLPRCCYDAAAVLLLCSRGATSWMTAQHIEHPLSSPSGLRQSWRKNIIAAIWHFHQQLWEQRNDILHVNIASSQPIRESPFDVQIDQLYASKLEFAASDRTVLDIPLATRLSQSTQSKKYWLSLVKRYKETTKPHHIGDQLLVKRSKNKILIMAS
jgi:hypothetical protein